MSDYPQYLEFFYQTSQIPVHYYRKGICAVAFGPLQIPFDLSYLNYQEEVTDPELKHGFFLEAGLYTGFVRMEEDQLITIGPVQDQPLPIEQYADLLRKRGIGLDQLLPFQKYMKQIPVLSYARFRAAIKLLAAAAGTLEEEPLSLVSSDPIYAPSPADLRQLNPEHSMVFHDTEHLEAQFITALRFGKEEELLSMLAELTKKEFSMGIFSLSTLKSAQTALIALTAILSRIAYSAGMSYDDALTIQDYYILQGQKARERNDVIFLIGAVFLDYCRQINKLRILSDSHPLVIGVCNDVAKHLYGHLRVADIAERLGYSVPYLSSAFSKETGISIKQYIMKEKTEEAKYLLLKGDSIAIVSEKLCFSSIAHFQTAFKNSAGVTPGEFIQSSNHTNFIP